MMPMVLPIFFLAPWTFVHSSPSAITGSCRILVHGLRGWRGWEEKNSFRVLLYPCYPRNTSTCTSCKCWCKCPCTKVLSSRPDADAEATAAEASAAVGGGGGAV